MREKIILILARLLVNTVQMLRRDMERTGTARGASLSESRISLINYIVSDFRRAI